MEKSIHSHSPKTTQRAAKELASSILAAPLGRRALVLALKGELGAGKTTFVQALAKALGARENVLSPTFLIVRSYKLPTKTYEAFYHVDCYRLQSPGELTALGWKEIVSDPKNIVAVEWAEKVRPLIPKDAVWFSFLHKGPNQREIRFAAELRVR